MESRQERWLAVLRFVLRFSGGYEIVMGLAMFFFIRPLLAWLGAGQELHYLMFPQCLGVLAVGLGVILLGTARDPGRYLLPALASILVRVLIQAPILLAAAAMPPMRSGLLAFGAFDLVLAAMTWLGIRNSGLDWKAF